MKIGRVFDAAEAAGLLVMGALHPARCGAKQLDSGTLVLFGAGAAFWPVFSVSQEARNTQPDPIDRWSTRVIGDLAKQFGGQAHYPFGGPPFTPFIDWAVKSGRAFISPTGMMVHDQVGLMISYRGALHFSEELNIPTSRGTSPCETCVEKPCASACPVGALSDVAPYDVSACHAYLSTAPGRACMTQGCSARLACPVSKGAGRGQEQTALHMKAFHPT